MKLCIFVIQECSAALNSLKYFKEKANEYHVLAAGSLLGTLLAKPKSYPVGMVNLINLYPLSFDEFIAAIDPPLYFKLFLFDTGLLKHMAGVDNAAMTNKLI
ncbi:AAA family ATPase [Syntrophobotulus glycolicus]|uniref:AAA family ATPase n=1 Tax=Syntrophobotulus glycolicus TaxID=51197 RepID=UPI00059E625D|nr:AAA family ATPase [Syntrophobotulus glycolicus]